MIATLHTLATADRRRDYLDGFTDDDAATLDPATDYRPRLVVTPNDSIPRPAHGAACIAVEHGDGTAVRTIYAADLPEHRNPAHWRALLGAGSLRLTSHPAGVDDAGGMATRRVLGVWPRDCEAEDAVRFDAAPAKVRVSIGGAVVSATLAACPGGVPQYVVADVAPEARAVRAARKVQA